MTEVECVEFAEQYLKSRKIEYLPTGRVGLKEKNRWEVIFPVPESMDSRIAVVDPPDVRVWVTLSDGLAELVHQM